jgi:hemophore-related protein
MAFTNRMIAGTSGVLLSLIAGSGIASAFPDPTPIINSTCSYPQVMAALNAQDPALAAQLQANPMATGWMHQLVNAGPAQRAQMVHQAENTPGVTQYTNVIMSVATTCNNF